MATIAEMSVRLGANIDDFNAKMNSVQGKADEISQKLGRTGKALTTKVTLPLAAVGAMAIKTGMDYESQMSRVQAISGATGGEFDKLKDQAKQLGATTVFTAKQAGEGMEYLALAGWGAQDIMSAMPGMLNLAAAGALELGTAADIASDTMSAFGIEASKASHVSDVFAYAQANANTSVEQMGEAMKYLGPVANSVGWDLEEASAAVMKLADSGIKGSMAGQAFSSSLVRLAAPTPKATKLMKKLGMQFFDTEGQMKSMPDVLAEIEKGTEGMSEQQRAAALDVLVGKNAYKQWAVLLDNGSDSLKTLTDELHNSEGAAQQMAETMMDNLGGSFIQLRSALEGAAISIYELIQGPIRAMVDVATVWVAKFIELDDKIKVIILAVAGLAAAIGPLLLAVAGIIKLWGIAAGAASVLGGAIGALSLPVLGVIAAIAALTAGIVYLWNTNEAFRNAVMTIWDGIKQAISVAVEFIAGYVMQVWGELTEWWAQNGERILSTANMVWSAVKDAIMNYVNFIYEYIMMWWNLINSLWETHGASLLEIASRVWTSVQNAITAIITFIQDMIMKIVGKIEALWNKHGEALKSTTTSVWSVLQKIVENAVNVIKSVVDFFLTAIKIMFDMWWPVITNVLSVAWELMKTIVNTAINVLSGIIDLGMSLITGNWQGAWEAIKGIAADIWAGIEGFFRNVDLWQIGKDIIQGLINGLDAMGEAAINKAKDIASGIKGAVTGFFKIKSPSRVMRDEVGKHIGSGLVIGMDAMEHKIDDASFRMAQAAMPAVENISPNGMDLTTKQSQRPVEVVIQMGTRAVARAILPDMTNLSGDAIYNARLVTGQGLGGV